MLAKCCLTCSRSITSSMRQQVISRQAKRLSNTSVYPPIYRLLERLPLCTACMEQLPFIEGNVCPGCGRVTASLEICMDCRRYADDHLVQNRSMMLYQEWGKEQVSQLKYRGDQRLASMLAIMLAIAYHRYYSHIPFRLVTHVPLHPSRLQERGFDQAALLAKQFAKIVNISYLPLLNRIKNTDKLSKQAGRYARYHSMHDAFSPRTDITGLKWKSPPHILIIDDIFTTGSTLRACASVIHRLPGMASASICSLTIFR